MDTMNEMDIRKGIGDDRLYYLWNLYILAIRSKILFKRNKQYEQDHKRIRETK